MDLVSPHERHASSKEGLYTNSTSLYFFIQVKSLTKTFFKNKQGCGSCYILQFRMILNQQTTGFKLLFLFSRTFKAATEVKESSGTQF